MVGDPGGDFPGNRFDATGFQTADSRSGAVVWQTALAMALAVNTYHIRIIGENFDNASTRRYRFGVSTDGMSYVLSDWLTYTHTYNATNVWDFETIDFESGVGVNMLVDNVVVTTHAPATFASWMGSFAFPAGANTTPTGDADNDGISNLVEQVFGTAPNAATTGLTQLGVAANSVTFKHPLNPDVARDVTYIYQWSSDLSEWQGSGVANATGTIVTITPATPVAGVVTVASVATTGSTPMLFTRIIATQTP